MEKRSNPPVVDATTDAKQQLAKILVNAGLLGLGTGAAYSGARGLMGLMAKPSPAVDVGSQLYDPIHVVRPQAIESEVKQANSLMQPVYDFVSKRIPNSFVPLTGDQAAYNWSVPALGIPLAAGGLYAGATGLAGLMNAYKKHRKSQELSDAERNYHAAVKKQFETALMDKSALDAAYDNYCAQLEKTAQGSRLEQPSEFITKTLPNFGKSLGSGAVNLSKNFLEGMRTAGGDIFQNSPTANMVAGTYGAGLLLTALLGGHLGYNYNKKRQQQKIMDRAILERRRARGLMQPLYAVPGSDDEAE